MRTCVCVCVCERDTVGSICMHGKMCFSEYSCIYISLSRICILVLADLLAFIFPNVVAYIIAHVLVCIVIYDSSIQEAS